MGQLLQTSIRFSTNHVLFVVIVMLVPCNPGFAGIYSTSEPNVGPTATASGVESMSFFHIQDTVRKFFLEMANPKSAIHAEYVEKRDALKRKAKRGPLPTNEIIDLSYYLLRLGQSEEAIALLRPAAATERSNFMVFANLGSAYQMQNDWESASRYLSVAGDLIPKKMSGIEDAQLDWYREAERFQRKLVRLRWKESRDKAPTNQSVDALFDSDAGALAYTGTDGNYTSGEIADAQKQKLPPRAMPLMQQLVAWFPQDSRLYWQLGELYNATGDPKGAAAIFDELVWTRRYDAVGLKEHRQVIQDAIAEAAAESKLMLPDTGRVWIVGSIAAGIAFVLGYFQFREWFRGRRRPI